MITIRSKTLFLCACLIEACWLLVAQMLNATAILLPCLLCFLLLVGWAAIKNAAMPVIMFFLPFAKLLKLRPGTISFFTIALLLAYGICTIIGSRQVKVLHLIPALLLVVMTLIVKAAYGYVPTNSYILFAVTLLLVPYLSHEMDGTYDFYWLTVCFSLGICLAAITAQFMTVFPTISRYITIDVSTTLSLARRSGYMGDPNFYATHITTALSGILLILLNNPKRSRLFVLIPLAFLLLYCGLLSISKSFMLICVCLLLLWVMMLLLQRGKVSIKAAIIVTLIIAFAFLLSTTVFTDMLDKLFFRFSQDTNLSDFTTGRTEVWDSYIQAIFSDVKLLLFGQGCTNMLLGDKATHNTLLQCFYQLGLIGCAILILWLVYFYQTLLRGTRLQRHQAVRLAIVLIGTFGPWVALDYLFFDEFFLLPIYVCIAVRFLHQQQETEKPLLN